MTQCPGMIGKYMQHVSYEDFGASGDGVSDDLPAICRAHEHANSHGLSVRSKPGATYHLGAQALTAKIATDTDWNTSRFTIDDTQVADHTLPLFEVCSLLAPEELRIQRLERDQKQLPVRPAQDCFVRVECDQRRIYIRRGLNQNSGVPQQDAFLLRCDGTVEGDIDWDYPCVTSIEARPIDDKPLVLHGGIFTTLANRMRQDVGYNYWSRNIVVSRSNTEIDGITHYVAGETAYGHPYRGFLSVRHCANAELRNCFVSGHKTYTTIGAAGKPVSMGSYDINANSVVNLRLFNCTMHHINDRTRWGVIASNFCKNILLQNCVLSRMDTHMGVSGAYEIRGCTIGYIGINAIGRGLLTVADSAIFGDGLLKFRHDYGATWDGRVIIRNCRWQPDAGESCKRQIYLIDAVNDGMHDFGYPCSMPGEVVVDGLEVDDQRHPEDYQGMFFFRDPDALAGAAAVGIPPAARPFPYAFCRRLDVRNLRLASGREPRLSPNPGLSQSLEFRQGGQQ